MDFEKSIVYMVNLDLELGRLYILMDNNSLMKFMNMIMIDGINEIIGVEDGMQLVKKHMQYIIRAFHIYWNIMK